MGRIRPGTTATSASLRDHLRGWTPGLRLTLVLVSAGLLYFGGVTVGAETGRSPSVQTSGSIAVGGPPSAISSAFWGLNVNPTIRFGAADVAAIEKTPVNFLRYPGGLYAEEYNYTSGTITKGDGTTSVSLNPIASFIGNCARMACRTILELPFEINSSGTAAYYVKYVEQTLGFTPTYWELGNSPGSYTHFDIPWTHWSAAQNSRISPDQFAGILKNYIAAIRAVDSSTPILALGGGEVSQNGDARWVIPMMQVDGPDIAGVSIHSYAAYPTPPGATLDDFFSLVTGPLGLPTLVAENRASVAQACSTCSAPVFITEDAPTYEIGPFYQFDAGFPGALFEAVQVTQALSLGLANVDWFEYESNFSGDWVYPPGAALSPEYTLFAQLLPHLRSQYVPTSFNGVMSGVYAAATEDPGGSALLVVNANTNATLTLDLGGLGFGLAGPFSEVYWVSGSSPQTLTARSAEGIQLAPLSVAVFSTAGSTIGGTVGVRTSTPPAAFPPAYLLVLGGLSLIVGAATFAFVPTLGRFLGFGVSVLGVVLFWFAYSA